MASYYSFDYTSSPGDTIINVQLKKPYLESGTYNITLSTLILGQWKSSYSFLVTFQSVCDDQS